VCRVYKVENHQIRIIQIQRQQYLVQMEVGRQHRIVIGRVIVIIIRFQLVVNIITRRYHVSSHESQQIQVMYLLLILFIIRQVHRHVDGLVILDIIRSDLVVWLIVHLTHVVLCECLTQKLIVSVIQLNILVIDVEEH